MLLKHVIIVIEQEVFYIVANLMHTLRTLFSRLFLNDPYVARLQRHGHLKFSKMRGRSIGRTCIGLH